MDFNFDQLPDTMPLKQHPEEQVHRAILEHVYRQLDYFLKAGSLPYLMAFYELATAVHNVDHVVTSPSMDTVQILRDARLIDGIDQGSKLIIHDSIRWVVFASTYRTSDDLYNLRPIGDVINIPDRS